MVVVVCTWYSGCMVWWWWVYVINQIWNSLVVESCFCLLLNQQAANPSDRARLQACGQKESGAWLPAPLISYLGLQTCNASIRIATLVSNWVLIYALPMTALTVEEEWTKHGYMA